MDEKLEELLDEFAKSIKFYKNTAPIDEPAPFLRVPREEMEKYSAEDCAEISLLLNQYALFLARAYNRENARYKMYEAALIRGAAKRWGEYGDVFGSTELKISIIAAGDEALTALQKKRDRAKLVLTDLDGLVMMVKQCADSWRQLEREKRG